MAKRKTKEPPPVRCEVVELPREMWGQLLALRPAYSAVVPQPHWHPQCQTWVPICLSAVEAQLRQNTDSTLRIRGAVLAWLWVSEWLLSIAWSTKLDRHKTSCAAQIGLQITVTMAPFFAVEAFAVEVP